jgi:SAM-dependent methyltransferase
MGLIPVNTPVRLLDFGCGDGLFLNRIKELQEENSNLFGFEPILESVKNNTIPIMKNWDEVTAEVTAHSAFDYVTCFEVLEHFAPGKQIELIEQMGSVLKKDGLLIVSVPIESGFLSLVKNIIRRKEKKRQRDLFSYQNIFASFLRKPLSAYRQGDDYLEHLGFYFQDLEKIFHRYFYILKKSYSPFGGMGSYFNSQIFYQLKKKI